ncbi:protein CHUP1, chloroplastic-like [Aristolochia californica]|uniref:protein CHUP1, chloroplastic-like n=1 Tax=Aristolochia californica TaxID=171875 RepID=UPI0035D6AAC0
MEMEDFEDGWVLSKERDYRFTEPPKLHQGREKELEARVEFMEAECRRLAEYLSVVSQLEAAKSEAEILKRKMRKLWRANRQGLRALHQQAGCLRLLEAESAEEKQGLEDTIVCSTIAKSQPVRIGESRIDGELQSREDGAREEPCKTVDEEKLLSQIEQLQNDRLANLEELIHLRWVNACLRYKLWRTQEQQKSSEKEATRRPPITQTEEHELKGAYDTTGYDSVESSPAMEHSGATAMEIAVVDIPA